MNKDNSDIKVCIGLSGGVDSSVAALLLKQAGYDVFALFMQNWHDASTTLHGDCEWEEDRFVAEMVARKIGIPFYFVDLSKEYRQRVVDYMFDEYEKGRTPNPDVLCNREIKFDAFLKCAEKLGADYVATGHYCRKESVTDAEGKEIHRILAGADPNKDQSYFLCQLTQEQLSKALFPIGDILKPEVRKLAREADLPSADKKDSQGICFVGKVDLPTFLQQKLKPCEGDVVEVYDAYYSDNSQYSFIRETLESILSDEADSLKMITDYVSDDKTVQVEPVACPFSMEKTAALSDEVLLKLSQPVRYDIRFETETYRSGRKHIKKTRYKENPHGKIVGRHDGAQFYTIGQRKGLNIGGHKDSIFVIETDIPNNIIYVGEGHTHKGLSRSCLRIDPSEIHWIREDLAMTVGEMRRYRVRIRYRQPLQDATLIMRSNGLYILFDQPQRGITPGQFAAWYAPVESSLQTDASDTSVEMLGSGVI
ncbi:MAG: tRNA 2-thiouridine(34) synthase MnmA [Bacteroidales bacterium]|nr:tRNA 2-thiouridine(34) synthase MnmA [Bacteroidales bacterium]MBQ9722663.1 tRNA 2-thiouridine(34) synthase MnmA [Bacteroidales bacterium]